MSMAKHDGGSVHLSGMLERDAGRNASYGAVWSDPSGQWKAVTCSDWEGVRTWRESVKKDGQRAEDRTLATARIYEEDSGTKVKGCESSTVATRDEVLRRLRSVITPRLSR